MRARLWAESDPDMPVVRESFAQEWADYARKEHEARREAEAKVTELLSLEARAAKRDLKLQRLVTLLGRAADVIEDIPYPGDYLAKEIRDAIAEATQP